MSKLLSVLDKYSNPDACFQSPCLDDYDLIFDVDSDGKEFSSFVKTDIKGIIDSLGAFSNWKLKNLLVSGVNPNFPIHTGYATRLDGINDLKSITASLPEVLESESDTEPINVESSK